MIYLVAEKDGWKVQRLAVWTAEKLEMTTDMSMVETTEDLMVGKWA